MYQFSDSIIELICEYLNYDDLLNLRSTCKKLKQFVDQKAFKEFYLLVNRNLTYHDLFYTNELVCYPNSFIISDFQSFNKYKFKNNFNQLQKFVILGSNDLKIKLNELNHFTELDHLEIVSSNRIEGKLCLEKLRISFFDTEENSPFVLDCPNLEALKIGKNSRPKIIGYKDSLKYLTLHFSEIPGYYLFDLFSSHENLSIICFSSFKLFDYFLIENNEKRLNLCSLKRIEISRILDYNSISLKDVIPNLSVFIENPSTKHIKIFFNGKLTGLKEFESIFNEFKQFKGLLSISYDKLKSSLENSLALECILPDIWCLDLEEPVELDEKILKKMKNLAYIKFKNKLEKSTFQFILKIFPVLTHLSFEELNFEFSELNQLPNYLPYLTTLIFPNEFKIGNLDFIGKLKNLTILHLPQIQLKKETLTYIFDNCIRLTSLCLRGRSQSIVIQLYLKKNNETDFRITSYSHDDFKYKNCKFNTLNSLINYIYDNDLLGFESIEEEKDSFVLLEKKDEDPSKISEKKDEESSKLLEKKDEDPSKIPEKKDEESFEISEKKDEDSFTLSEKKDEDSFTLLDKEIETTECQSKSRNSNNCTIS